MANANPWAGGRPPQSSRIPARRPPAPPCAIPAPSSRIPTPGAGRSIPSCCSGTAPPPRPQMQPQAPGTLQRPLARGLRPPQAGLGVRPAVSATRAGVPAFSSPAAPPRRIPAPVSRIPSSGTGRPLNLAPAVPPYGRAAPPATRPALPVPAVTSRIPSPTAVRPQLVPAAPSAVPSCCRGAASTSSRTALGASPQLPARGLLSPGFSRPTTPTAPSPIPAAAVQRPVNVGCPQPVRGLRGPAAPVAPRGLRPPAREMAQASGIPRMGTQPRAQAVALQRTRSPCAAAGCGSFSRSPSPRPPGPKGRAGDFRQVAPGVPVQKESYTRRVKTASRGKAKQGARIRPAPTYAPAAPCAAPRFPRRDFPAIISKPSPAMTSPRSPLSDLSPEEILADISLLDDEPAPWTENSTLSSLGSSLGSPGSPGAGYQMEVSAPCSPKGRPPMTCRQQLWNAIADNSMIEDTEQPWLVDNSIDTSSESAIISPRAYMRSMQQSPNSYQRPMTTPYSTRRMPPMSPNQQEWGMIANDTMIEDTDPPWLLDDPNNSLNQSVITSPNRYIRSTQQSQQRSTCPGAIPSDAGMQFQTGNAASQVIENLRSQEEYEMESMINNLRDLQSYRRRIIGNVLPDTSHLHEIPISQLAMPSASSLVKESCASTSCRSRTGQGTTMSNPLINISPTPLNAQQSANDLQGTETYSKELFDLVKL